MSHKIKLGDRFYHMAEEIFGASHDIEVVCRRDAREYASLPSPSSAAAASATIQISRALL
jgi:hypothetical protein